MTILDSEYTPLSHTMLRVNNHHSVVNKHVHLDPEVGWDDEACLYFNELMMQIEYDMVLAKEDVVVEVQTDIEYEGEELALDKEEWQLLYDLNDQVAELERAI